MIRGHIALVRLLRHYMESTGLPWSRVTFIHDEDEDGRPIYDPQLAEVEFRYGGHDVNIAISAPSEEIGGKNPLGTLAARIDGVVVRGPIDPATWDEIRDFIERSTIGGMRGLYARPDYT